MVELMEFSLFVFSEILGKQRVILLPLWLLRFLFVSQIENDCSNDTPHPKVNNAENVNKSPLLFMRTAVYLSKIQ